MARKLFEKAGLIQLPTTVQRAPEQAAGVDDSRAKTAPGTMLQFMATQSSAIKEAETLRDQLAQFEGAAPVRRLDPRRIRVSTWANRHPASFEGLEFAALKEEIAAAGGNVQPIKVRPVVGEGVGPSNPSSGSEPADYEIVFGHRRHRACLELGIPVLALIEPVSEQELFVAMERENRGRKDLSAWEQGMMYARALDAGLYPSNRQLAASVGRDLGDVGKALALARLPRAVVEAFASPLDLQYRWAKPLADVQQKDPEALLARAKAVKERGELLSSRQVLDLLLGKSGAPKNVSRPADIPVMHERKTMATVSSDDKGRAVVVFEHSLEEGQRRALAKLLKDFLAA